MRARPTRWARSARLPAAVLAAVLAAGCTSPPPPPAGDPGVTPTSVRIGTHAPLSGPAAPGRSRVPVGARAYYAYVNDAGGVQGRTIDYLVRDDAGDPGRAASAVTGLVEQDRVFAVAQGIGGTPHRAVLELLARRGVPDLLVGSGAVVFDQPRRWPRVFGWQPDGVVEGKVLGTYVQQQFPAAKVGLLLQGDDLGNDGGAGVRQVLGDRVVAEASYPPGDLDLSAPVRRLEEAGVDVVVAFGTPAAVALSQLQAIAQGLSATWCYGGGALDVPAVGALLETFSQGKLGAGVLEGMRGTAFLAGAGAPEDPWVQLWQRVWAAKGDGAPLTDAEVFGMAGAYTVVQALAATGRDLTRARLVAALEALPPAPSPPLAPYDYGPTSHRGVTGARVVQVAGGVAVPVGPVLTTSDAPGAPVVEDASAATDAPPPSGVPGG